MSLPRMEIERGLMQVTRRGGFRALTRLFEAVLDPEFAVQVIEASETRRVWEVSDRTSPRKTRIAVFQANGIWTVKVSAAPRPPVALTPTAHAIKRIHDDFYSRYASIGHRVTQQPRARLSASDRLVLLIGDFEADVNNGGFDQFLLNKGIRRARSTAKALRQIGALRVVALLDSAMNGAIAGREVADLESRFARTREDLARLTMRAIASLMS